MLQTPDLYQLQQIDLSIIQNQKRLKEIEAILADNSTVAQAQAGVEKVKQQLVPLRTKLRNLELDIQTNAEKFTASEQRLYSGNVKNPKELQEIQQEITSLKNRNNDLEDSMLELMMSIEETENTLDSAENTLEDATNAFAEQNSELMNEKSALESDNASLLEKREEKKANIDDDMVDLYNSLRRKKANKPIAPLQGRSCGVCGIEQTMAIEQEVRRNQDVIYCVNCERILVDSRMVDGG